MTGEVGYRRPPPEHQWKKGQSGNPRGSKRPNGFFEAVVDILGEKTPSTAGLRSRSAYQLLLLRLSASAIKGDNRALFEMINLILLHEAEAKYRSSSRNVDAEAIAATTIARLKTIVANRPSPPSDEKPRKWLAKLTAAEMREVNRKAKRMAKEEKQKRDELIRNRGY